LERPQCGAGEAASQNQRCIGLFSGFRGAATSDPHIQALPNDPFFIEKVRDIVGLYLNPPDHALVLCVDEKSQIQASESDPGL